jgi:hypothetical protein
VPRRTRFLAGLLLVLLAVPSMAEDDFELKVASPDATVQGYDESFPTDVQATARLWSQVKIDALEEQTRSLQVEFEKFKTVRFERQTSLANHTGSLAIQGQPQPEHYPALMATGIRW